MLPEVTLKYKLIVTQQICSLQVTGLDTWGHFPEPRPTKSPGLPVLAVGPGSDWAWRGLLEAPPGATTLGLGIMRAEGLWGNHVPVTLRCQARGEGGEASSRPNQPCNPIFLPGETGKHLVPPALQSACHTHRHSCQGAMMDKQRPPQTIQMANGQALLPQGHCGSAFVALYWA